MGSASSIMDFRHYLTDAYLLFLVPRYDTSLKVQARNPRNVYAIDQGLVNFSSVSGSPDRGRLLENAVYLHLRRSGQEVWYFKGVGILLFRIGTGEGSNILAIQRERRIVLSASISHICGPG